MRVDWEVEDGYVGKSRPQHTIIDDGELAECQTKEERQQFIESCVQEDFDQKITFFIKGTAE